MSRQSKGALALLAALLITVSIFPKAHAAPSKVMGKMPAWRMTDSTGRTVSSAALKGKVLIVDFWASWCPPCREEIPGFIALQNRYGSRGLQVVGFSMDRSPEDHAQFVKDHKINYPSVYVRTPEGQKVAAAFEKVIGQIQGIPTTLVVDRQGNIVFSHTGSAPQETFEQVVVPLLGR